jgi:hypothetical protein
MVEILMFSVGISKNFGKKVNWVLRNQYNFVTLIRTRRVMLCILAHSEIYPLVFKTLSNFKYFKYKIGSFDPKIESFVPKQDTNIDDGWPYMPMYQVSAVKVTIEKPFYFHEDNIVLLDQLVGNYDPTKIDAWWYNPTLYVAVNLKLNLGFKYLNYGFLVDQKYLIKVMSL